MKSDYKKISSRAKALLELSENHEVDYKSTINKVESEDFVAFANSKKGGAILFGVDEIKGTKGLQKSVVRGCEPTDDNKLKILNKALSCVPQIDISVFFENIDSIPFIRVEIPSGSKKPYCTAKGIYCIRENGRNRALFPIDLLTMFLENESGEFYKRFTSVTESLQSNVQNLDTTIEKTTSQIIEKFQSTSDELYSHVEDVSDNINDVEQKITETLNGIFESSDNASQLADDAMNISDETLCAVNNLEEKVDNISYSIADIEAVTNALIANFNIEHPRITRRKKFLEEAVLLNYSIRPNAKFKTIMKMMDKFIVGKVDQQMIEHCRKYYNTLKLQQKDPNSDVSKFISMNKIKMQHNPRLSPTAVKKRSK